MTTYRTLIREYVRTHPDEEYTAPRVGRWLRTVEPRITAETYAVRNAHKHLRDMEEDGILTAVYRHEGHPTVWRRCRWRYGVRSPPTTAACIAGR